MITRINDMFSALVPYVALIFVAYLTVSFLQPLAAQAVDAEPTYPVTLEKNISDNKMPDPYTADQFSFIVEGTSASGTPVSETVSLTAFTDDTANAIVNLPKGEYTLSEEGPIDFVPEDWTVQWSGYACVNGNGPIRSTILTVEGDETADVCRADNQWRGEPEPIAGCTDPEAENYDPAAEEDDGSCTYDGENGGNETGTLIVQKVVHGGTAATSSFSFIVNDGGATSFESDGENVLTKVATGTYSVVEVPVANYTASYSNCTSVAVTANATTTCIITNTYNNNGGGDDDEDLYLVYGYVWHDENENDAWEKEQPNPEDDENDLDGWTVTITDTDGEETQSTTTDATGYYYFYVEAGTWRINEVLQSGWEKTYPNIDGHVVTVGEMTQAPQQNLFALVMSTLIPTAHAAVAPTTYGPYNFGNVFRGGNGGYSQGSYGGGNGKKVELRDGGGSNNNDDDDDGGPIPQVLGAEATLPQGAPGTGAGGASPITFGQTLVAILTSRNSTRASHGKRYI